MNYIAIDPFTSSIVTTITIVTTGSSTSSGSFITSMSGTDFSHHAQQAGPIPACLVSLLHFLLNPSNRWPDSATM
jgi:hypothetical protein